MKTLFEDVHAIVEKDPRCNEIVIRTKGAPKVSVRIRVTVGGNLSVSSPNEMRVATEPSGGPAICITSV